MEGYTFRYEGEDGRLATKKIPTIKLVEEADDPTEWLRDGKKPELTVPKAGTAKLGEVCQYFSSQSGKPEDIEPEVALYLLYALSKKYIKVNIKKDLELKDKVILQAGERSISDIFAIREGEVLEMSGDNTTGGESFEELQILATLVANYRICGISGGADNKYIQNIKSRMNRTFVQNQIIKEEIQENYYNALTWVNNPNFTRLCAGIDLLLFQEKNHIYSSLRMATQSSKFKDCALIGEMDHFLTSLSEKPMAAWEHALDHNIAKEIINIMTILSNGYSGEFANYAKEMGAMGKSPFSVTANPNLHNWMHMICALLSNERSMNARLAGGNQNAVFLNALACAYTYRSKSNIKATIYRESKNREAEIINREGEDDKGMSDTAENMKALRDDGEEARIIWDWFIGKKNVISDDRPGTIGAYLVSKMS